MSQPSSYAHPQFPNHVCHLKKTLYGLKQAPRAQFSRLSNKLLEFGFRASKSNTSLFIYKYVACTIYVLIYVDDIIITSLITSEIDNLLHSMASEFVVKDLGELNFFFWAQKWQGYKMVFIFISIVICQTFYREQKWQMQNLFALQCLLQLFYLPLMVRYFRLPHCTEVRQCSKISIYYPT